MTMDTNNPNLEKLLAMVGKRLGTDPGQLRQQLEGGHFDSLFAKMPPKDAEKLQQLMNNPKMAQQVINTPQAKKALENFIREANQGK